jgi:hypothetical protein
MLLKKMKFDRLFSLLFTALFAVHPALSSAVAWIPGRNVILLTVFVISSVIFLFDYFENGKKSRMKLVLSVFMFAAALFTKESASVMIAVSPVFMFLFCKNVSKKDYLIVCASAVLIFILYMSLRFFALGGAVPNSAFDAVKSIRALAIYCEYAIIPSRIYLFPEKVFAGFQKAVGCLLMLVPFCASIFFNIGMKKVIVFGMIWFLLFLAPSFMASGYMLSLLPHRLYCVSVGAVLVFVEFFTAVSDRIKPVRNYAVSLLCIFIILFAFASYVQVKKFENKEVYLLNAVNEQPGAELLRIKQAEYYADKGMFGEAKKAILSLKNDSGTHSTAYYETLGYVYSLEGSYNKAIEIFEQLYAINPDNEAVMNNLGEIYYLKGDYGKALVYAEKLIKIRPGHSSYNMQYNKIQKAYDEK